MITNNTVWRLLILPNNYTITENEVQLYIIRLEKLSHYM